jgi:HTH-like domain
VEHVTAKLGVSGRFACKVLGQHRATQRKAPRAADDEAALTTDIIALARQFGRYGYRRITALLRAEGWRVNHKRVERIWRREGLKVPPRQPKRGRLWLNDGSCVRLRPERANHARRAGIMSGLAPISPARWPPPSTRSTRRPRGMTCSPGNTPQPARASMGLRISAARRGSSAPTCRRPAIWERLTIKDSSGHTAHDVAPLERAAQIGA